MPGDRPIRVLLVDDSRAFLGGASEWLAEQNNVEVVGTAESGVEAVSAVDRLRPDLVLMDLVMPGIDGFAATRAIKSMDNAPSVVIVTFQDTGSMRAEAAEAGADELIVKSDFVEALAPVIARLTGS
ncbi:MAG: response regulator transcription factor [bacterium]|nr:response regulator transcription factor [bacterium]